MTNYYMAASVFVIFQCALLLLLSGEDCKSNGESSHKVYDTDNPDYIPDAQVIFPSLVDPSAYALATCPRDTVFIAQSTLPNAGLGAFASRRIEQGTYFGSYFGYKHKDMSVAYQNRYAWILKNDCGEIMYAIDGLDPQHSNWLRYVNCPNTVAQENLMPVQYFGEIFYEAIRDIDAGEELLVYYGDEYANGLGINTTQFYLGDLNNDS